jgi:hypothetical protein
MMIAHCLFLLTSATASILWTNATALTVRNQHDWKQPLPNPYARLPTDAKSHIRSSVYGLSTMAAGVQVAFTTNASSISLRWRMSEARCGQEATVPIALCAGPDLYVWDALWEELGGWRWAGTATNITIEDGISGKSTYWQLHMFTPPRSVGWGPVERAYLLHLPMYGVVLDCAIGIPTGESAGLAPLTSSSRVGPPAPSVKPIVWYGTSITQGAAASRPGMGATNIVSRTLNVDVLNFGFSGNGKLELNVTEYLVQIDASALILDCLHNMDADLVANNTEPLVRYYRSKHPDTPIVFAEGIPYGSSWEGKDSPARKNQLDRRQQFKDVYMRLEADNVPAISYYTGDQLLWQVPHGVPNVPWQPTEGGTHPSDLGMASMATAWNKYLPSVVPGLEPGLGVARGGRPTK